LRLRKLELLIAFPDRRLCGRSGENPIKALVLLALALTVVAETTVAGVPSAPFARACENSGHQDAFLTKARSMGDVADLIKSLGPRAIVVVGAAYVCFGLFAYWQADPGSDLKMFLFEFRKAGARSETSEINIPERRDIRKD
jgi:hypothetical protein